MELLTWPFTGKLTLGPFNLIVLSTIISSKGNSTKYAIGSATCSTTHDVDFNWYCGGKGSYNFIKIEPSSNKILLAITSWLLPKFK